MKVALKLLVCIFIKSLRVLYSVLAMHASPIDVNKSVPFQEIWGCIFSTLHQHFLTLFCLYSFSNTNHPGTAGSQATTSCACSCLQSWGNDPANQEYSAPEHRLAVILCLCCLTALPNGCLALVFRWTALAPCLKDALIMACHHQLLLKTVMVIMRSG